MLGAVLCGLIALSACGDDDEPLASAPDDSAVDPGLTSTIIGMNEDGSLATGDETWNRNPDVTADGTVVTATIRNDGQQPEEPGPWALQRWTGDEWETVGFISNGQSTLCRDPDVDCLILPTDFGPLAPGEIEARAAATPDPLPAATYRIEADGLARREHFVLP